MVNKFNETVMADRLVTERYIASGIRGFRRGRGRTPPPPENHKAIGFLAILARIRWKITKPPGHHSMLGHHRLASEMSFRWWADEGPLLVLFGSSHSSLYKLKKAKKKKTQKNKQKKPTLSEMDHL